MAEQNRVAQELTVIDTLDGLMADMQNGLKKIEALYHMQTFSAAECQACVGALNTILSISHSKI